MTLTLETIAEDLSRLFPPESGGSAEPAAEITPAETKAAPPNAPSGAGPGAGSPQTPAAKPPETGAPSPATPPAQAPSPMPPKPGCVAVDFAVKGYHLDVTAQPEQVVAAASTLDQLGFAIDAVTGVDWMAQEQMEVVYDYFHPLAAWRVAVRCRVPRANPELPTISGVFPGANWHERETHELLGIRFQGHPQLIPLLLPEDADYHPLRKDFKA